MQSKLTLVALALALLALVVSAYALTREESTAQGGTGPSVAPPRLAKLEEQVKQLTEELDELRSRPAALREVATGAAPVPVPPGGDHAADAPAATAESLKALVDKAVEEKARSVTEKMAIRAKKDPAMEEFAAALELTDEQRRSVEDEVIRGQREVFGILETLTESGDDLLEELVELYATSIAEPGEEAKAGWGTWIGKVLTEKVPGTNETYGTRVEAVKASMRAAFRQVFTEKQYAEFSRWGVDPVEIEGIEGSPGEALGVRIVERARELGAEIPETGGD